MKKLFNKTFTTKVLAFNLLFGFLFTSCGNKIDEPDNDINSDKTGSVKNIEFLGGWEISNLPPNYQFVIFFENGKVYNSIKNNMKLKNWQYDPTTKVLATDIINYNDFPYTWEINLITNESWTGYYYFSTSETKRIAYASYQMYDAIQKIILSTKWFDKDGKNLSMGYKFSGTPSSMSPASIRRSPWLI